MESVAEVISALASLAWPLVIGALLYKLYPYIKTVADSARARKFTIKVAGNELTMEEASEQQRTVLADLQAKLAALERQVQASRNGVSLATQEETGPKKRILWVDDKPRNNSFMVAALEERGARVDTARSTQEGLQMFRKSSYDTVISDMGRPEGERAGIDFAKLIKRESPQTPVFIFCGKWPAQNLREEALKAGVSEITSSGTTLLSELLR